MGRRKNTYKPRYELYHMVLGRLVCQLALLRWPQFVLRVRHQEPIVGDSLQDWRIVNQHIFDSKSNSSTWSGT